jgi:ABC-type transport system involved in multi-copper enzyme maturation permease subunit
VTFVVITTIIADIPTRDSSAGTTALLYSLPRVRRAFVVTKFLGAALTALAFLIVPMLRLGVGSPGTAFSLAIGGLFVSAAAVFLGRLTGSSKAFTGLFLLFLYVVLSSKGDPGLDFAGWNGVETASARLGYLLAAVAFVAIAMIRHLAEGRRT